MNSFYWNAAIQKISHANWKIAEKLVQSWREIDQLDWLEREAIETDPLYPNRRPPVLALSPFNQEAAVHPSRALAEQQIPLRAFLDGFYGYFRRSAYAPVEIAIDADSRESALVGWQVLDLLTQDAEICRDLFFCRQIRFQKTLPQLGVLDGNDRFSLRSTQSVPQAARAAAHQIGEFLVGPCDLSADSYARRYANRNARRFQRWREQIPLPRPSSGDLIRDALEIVKRHAPDAYSDLKGYRIKSNEQTPDATPYDLATQLAFVGLQRRSERDLRNKGVSLELPLDLPGCISPQSVNILSPEATPAIAPQNRSVPVIGLLEQPAFAYSDPWQPGRNYGYFQVPGGQAIAIDADSYSSAKAGWQALETFVQDEVCRNDLIAERINRIRFRRPLIHPDGESVWGYCDGSGVFSIKAQGLRSTTRTIAHELRHHQGYNSEEEADAYEAAYARRASARFS